MDIISEVWQQVKGFEGFYEVSSLGNVRRVAATSNVTYTGRLLKPQLNTTGYYMVSLFVNNKGKHIYIHRLVAEAFIGDRPEGCQINHKDGNKLNNHPSNLEYVTHKQNMQHAQKTGLTPFGERHGRAVLTEDIVKEIIKNPDNESTRSLAKKHGVSYYAIWAAMRRKTWRHLDPQAVG